MQKKNETKKLIKHIAVGIIRISCNIFYLNLTSTCVHIHAFVKQLQEQNTGISLLTISLSILKSVTNLYMFSGTQ